MGLQSKADAGATALETDDAAYPRNLIPASEPTFQQTPTGEILSSHAPGVFDIRVAETSISARRAMSCLLEPKPGDLVALLSTSEGIFVTDVLVRKDAAEAQYRLNIGSDSGAEPDMVISAGSLKVEASKSFEADAKAMSFRFEDLLMSGNQLAFVGSKLLTSMRDIITNAKKQLASFELSSTRARNRVDRVDETDQLRAGHIRSQADSVALTQAGTSLVVAKEDIRLDGKRISMG